MGLVEQAITEWWGPRCPDYEKGCPVCDAWTEYDMSCSSDGFTRFEYIGDGGRLLTLYGEFKTMAQDEGRTLKVVGDKPLPA